MSQNRAGLTFEALIHENKKRPNNRLQKLLEQKLFILNSMKQESDRLYRKEKRELQTRQRIYHRILGSLERTYTSEVSRKSTRMSQFLDENVVYTDPLSIDVTSVLYELNQDLYGVPARKLKDEIETADTNIRLDDKRTVSGGAFGVRKPKPSKDEIGESEEVVTELIEVPEVNVTDDVTTLTKFPALDKRHIVKVSTATNAA